MLRLSCHFSTFGLVFFVLKSLLGIARQWSLEKFAILTLKPRSHVRILTYRMSLCTFVNEVSNLARVRARKSPGCVPILWAMQVIYMYNQTKIST